MTPATLGRVPPLCCDSWKMPAKDMLHNASQVGRCTLGQAELESVIACYYSGEVLMLPLIWPPLGS